MSIYYKNIGMKYIFYILIFCFPLSCNNTTSRLKPNSQSDIDTISITQGLKNQIEEFKLSDVVKEIEIIPLETCPKSIFKFIDNIIVTENDLFVNARISVLRFDRKTGLFINQIGSRGQGPEEFISCAGIGVNETLKNVYVFSSEDNRIQIYSFDGSFISSKQLLPKGKTSVGSQHEENRTYTFWGDKHMLRRMLPLSDGSKDFWSVQMQDTSGNILAKFYDPLNIGFEKEMRKKQIDGKNTVYYYWTEDSPVFNRYKNSVHFLFDSNDTIYKFNNQSYVLKPHYFLDCGVRPSVSSIRQLSKDRSFFDYTFVKNMWETKDYLFLLAEHDRYISLLRYDKVSKETVSIRAEGEIKNSPVMQILYREVPVPRFTNDLSGGLGFFPYFQNEHQWITMLDAEDLLEIDLNELEQDNLIFPNERDQLIQVLKRMKLDDNPIIMIATLK